MSEFLANWGTLLGVLGGGLFGLLFLTWLAVRWIPNSKVGMIEKIWSGKGSLGEGQIIAIGPLTLWIKPSKKLRMFIFINVGDCLHRAKLRTWLSSVPVEHSSLLVAIPNIPSPKRLLPTRILRGRHRGGNQGISGPASQDAVKAGQMVNVDPTTGEFFSAKDAANVLQQQFKEMQDRAEHIG
jgi:hypothetical protein